MAYRRQKKATGRYRAKSAPRRRSGVSRVGKRGRGTARGRSGGGTLRLEIVTAPVNPVAQPQAAGFLPLVNTAIKRAKF